MLAAAVLLAAGAALSNDKGMPIFGDSFDVVGTFAENWVSKNCTPGDGVVKIPAGANMRTRVATPLEFVAELDVTTAYAKGFEKRGQNWGGFFIDGKHFSAQPNGKSFAVWRIGDEKRSSGKYIDIPGFAPGKSVRLRLVCKAVPGGVKYSFYANGAPAGDFIAPVPALKTDAAGASAYSPLVIQALYADIVVDNFLLSTVRHGDDSPNMVFNSGFEHGEDGVPTYYGFNGRFNYAERPAAEYETRYLKRFAQDPNERHSGRYSLRVLVNNASKGISLAPWQTGTVKGLPGVFSVWMKASTNGLPVEISYSPKGADGRKTVKVTTEWRRYEVTRTELAGKGTYTPVHVDPVNPAGQDAILWIDDLQAEVVALPPGGRFDPEKTYATPYKPSELDKDRFGEKPVPETPATLVVRKLPAGVKPTADLDAWKRDAFEVMDFWQDAKTPRIPTTAYLACDGDNLYLGFRSFRENPASLVRPRTPRDGMIFTNDGLELFFQPDPDGGYYHFMATANGDQFDCYANDIKWNGAWTVSARENKSEESVDTIVTIPFADFAPNGFTGRWRVNLCRNEWSQKGAEVNASTAKHRKVDYRVRELWNPLEIPSDVAAKWSGRAVRREAAAADAVLGRLDYYMNEEFAEWRVTGADGTVTVAKKPLAEIPAGTNSVTFTANGKTYTDTVVKLPFRKAAVQVNKWARCLVKDGEKVLFTAPSCIWAGVGWNGWKPGNTAFYDTMMKIMADAGFVQTMGGMSMRDPKMTEAKALFEAVRAHGLQYANWSDYGMDLWENFPATRKRDERIRVAPPQVVAAFRPYEDIFLTNLVIDEPELYMTSDWTRSWLEYMKAFYPYHPVQMNNTVMGIPSKFADLKTDVLMLDDYLTNSEGRTVDSVVRQVDVMRAAPGGKPCWYFIVSNNTSLHYKLPTYAEQIAQSWGCICAGCSGIAWYFELPVTEGCWNAMKQVNREAQALKDVILSEELCGEAKADQPKSRLRHMTRTLNGAWYVLSCNIDRDPLEKVSFALPGGAPKSGTVEVLYENRTLPLSDGVFTDSYAGHTRHLYKIVPEE